jgi:hypothetical protein
MLNLKTYVVKERVGFMKLASTYDLLDPDTSAPIGIAKEEPPGFVKYLRLLVNNRWLPTVVNVYEKEGDPPVLSIHRGVALFRPKVHVHSRSGDLGYFRAKAISIGPSSACSTPRTVRWAWSKATGRVGTSSSWGCRARSSAA